MTDEFEAKIESLFEDAHKVWTSGEIYNLPDKQKDHTMITIYLKFSYIFYMMLSKMDLRGN